MELETDSLKLRAIAAEAEAFAKEHVVEMCAELSEWSKTSLLRNGRVRELARMLKPVAGEHYALSTAESYVKHAAFEFVVQQGKTSE